MGIINKEGSLYMATGIDNSGLYSGLNQAEGRVDQFEAHIKRVGDNITRLTGVGLGVAGLKAFGSEIVNVRGEMQLLESSFEVLLGGKGVSGFMSEMKQFAVDSPLSMNGVANAAQTLLGFGIEAEKVMPTIKQIGDISMGNEERFKSLSLAFAQMSATGKLMGQDLLQMINAGFNPLQVISEKTGKSIGELKKEMESGSISSQMVADAFASATAEGGKFYGMTQKQAEGIKGLQAQLEGGLQDAFNNIGKSQNELITGGYKVAISLVENYEKVGRILIASIATYGAYRTALMLNVFATQSMATTQMMLGITLARVQKMWQALTATMSANPYVAIATVAVGLVATVWALHDATTTQEKAQERLNKINEEAAKRKQDLEDETSKLTGIINSETKTIFDQISAYEKLQGKYPDLLKNMDLQAFKAMSTTEQQKLLNQAMNDMEGISLDEQIVQYQKTLTNLTENIGKGAAAFGKYEKEAEKLLGLDGFWDSRANDEYDIQRELKVTLDLLKEEKTKREEIRKEAEFLKLPEEERKRILQNNLIELEKQRDNLQEQITGIGGINTAWGKLSPTFYLLNGQLETILGKIEDTRSKLTGNPAVKNKSFWETQKKSATEALDAMDESEKGSVKWRAQVKLLNEANSNLGTWDFSNKAGKQAESAAEKARKKSESVIDQENKIAELQKKQTLANARALQDIENQVAQSWVDNLADGAEKVRAQIELNNHLELQAIDRAKEDYINQVIQTEKEKFDENEELEKKKNDKYKKKTFDPKTVTVDTSSYDIIRKNIREKQIQEEIKSEEKAWNEYFLKFGNYQQKRKAIIEKYDKEIAQAKTKGEEASLEKERENQLDELDNSIKGSTTLMAQLFADTSRKSVGEIQKIIDKVQLLMRYLESAKDGQGNAFLDGKSVSKQDILNLGVSENTLNNLQSSTQEIDSLKKALVSLQDEVGSRSPFLKMAIDIEKAKKMLNDGKLPEGIDLLSSSISDMSSSLGQFRSELASAFGDDGLAKDIEEWTSTLQGYWQTNQGIAKIAMGDVSGVTDVMAGLPKVISGITNLFGADYSQYNDLKDQYTGLLNIWDELIDKKKEYLSISYGDEAVKAEEEALNIIRKQEEATRKLAEARLQAGSSAGSHSLWYRMWKGSYKFDGMNWQDVAGDASKGMKEAGLGDVKFTKMEDMLNMSSEQLLWLKENYSGLWSVMDGDFRGYLEQLIVYGDQAKEVLKQTQEQLTGVSFDSVFDSFISTLSDMKSSAHDFADDFEGYMINAILSTMMAEKYKDRLQSWYDNWAKANEDGNITQEEMDASRTDWGNIVADAVKERDRLKDLFNWGDSSSQSSSYGASTSMDQETGGLMVGQLTGIHETDIKVEQNTFNIFLQMKELNQVVKGFTEDFQAIRNVGIQSVFLLEEIRDSNKELYPIRKALDKIEKNTEGLIKK